MDALHSLATAWQAEPATQTVTVATTEAVVAFQQAAGLLLPADMTQYFLTVNGSNDQYDANFFAFYTLANLTSIQSKFADYHGVPKYSDLLYTFDQCGTCYVFADFMISLTAYAIQLHPEPSPTNTVYVVCGGVYKAIASSFSEFLELYVADSDKLYL
ncbi:hypothetical protein E5K00_06705 [Hymenobacter aquaticus]|uniref:Knr4/Smi1-like domain-containing protein n=1 Tax=Hymenobacter aquaticus TaxID=1867101 RepID=A0A4Z0Q5D3_9BACT|nr:SMI1/KNR4 family protein [Hymenobacter aquaticus]TGE24885.1 hypothetical protein E5K00_06705 [Hymenobacter aquaticus]